ncbi:MAG: cation:proton antiporter [Ichthyobacteriaceae bacterium]|nr:cation:proton antiporter [Ichthyobacteriaceae bacterium]
MVSSFIYLAVAISLISVLIVLVRFAKGPEKVDRIVAFDVISIIGVSLILLIATLMKRVIYIDVAIVYAILGFIGVVVVSRFIKKGL